MPESYDLDDYDPIGPPPSLEPQAPPPAPPPTQVPSRRNPTVSGNIGQPATSQPPTSQPVTNQPPTSRPPTGNVPRQPRTPTGSLGPTPPPRTPQRTGSIGTGRVGGQGGNSPTEVGSGQVPTRSQPGATRGPGNTQVGVPPHTKASDLLRGHANYKASEARENKPKLPFLTEERRPTRADDFFTGLFYFGVTVAGLCLVYYLIGLFSGSLSTEAFGRLDSANQARIYTNLQLAHNILEYALIVVVGCMLFLFYDEGAAGYGLVIGAVFFQVLLPLIGSQYFALARTNEGAAAHQLYKDAAEVAWIPGIPGILLIVTDLIRKFINGLEEARFKRKNLQYGQGVAKAAKSKNVFLGFCWNMQYCRPEIKTKCPIFLRKRGPCWRNKRGCMCDETIVLNANSDNWKAQVASADAQLQGGAAGSKPKPKPVPIQSTHQQLSAAFKRERCRQCVIYNTHQEQKYKALVAATFVLCGYAFYQWSPLFLNTVITGYHQFDNFAQHISFTASSGAAKPTDPTDGRPKATTGEEVMAKAGSDLSAPVAWVLLIIVSIVVLSKVLNFIEYCCFKLKI